MHHVARRRIIGDVYCQGLSRIVPNATDGSRVWSDVKLQVLLLAPDPVAHCPEHLKKAAQTNRAEQRNFASRMTGAYIHHNKAVGPTIGNLVQGVKLAVRQCVRADHNC